MSVDVWQRYVIVLIAAVVLLSLLTAFNLLLTFGVIRRLRVHTSMLSTMSPAGAETADIMVPPGGAPGPFPDCATTDGTPLARPDLDGLVVGFFSENCTGCREQLPHFVAAVRSLGRERVLAVVAGDPAATRKSVAALEPVARVLVEPDEGPVQRAFAVQGFPAMGVLDDSGRVRGTAFAVADLVRILADRVAVG